MQPFVHWIPEVKTPLKVPDVTTRLLWVGFAILMFFLMYNTTAVGLEVPDASGMNFLSVVTASNIGSLLTIGIGPIVLASIFLQLFKGAGLIDLDMSDPNDKKIFYATQKILGVSLAIIEAIFFVFVGSYLTFIAPPLFGSVLLMKLLVVVQLAGASIILLFLDDLVSKYGIGSGISLFIAAGVSFMIFTGAINIFIGSGGFLETLTEAGAGTEVLPNALITLLPLFFTILVFAIVVYAEGLKVEIPIAYGRARGMGSRYPIKFLYVSNIPVILASALLLNVQLFGGMLPPAAPDYVIPEGEDFIGRVSYALNTYPTALLAYVTKTSSTDPTTGQVIESPPMMQDGLLLYLTPAGLIPQPGTNFFSHIHQLVTSTTPVFGLPKLVHLLFYLVFFTLVCVIFGQFWVETSGMSAKDVSKQLHDYGLLIPGMRRDPRLIESVLNKYLPTIIILGSAFVGLIAVFANLTGALGTGTGILLTVGIMNRFYDQLKSLRAFESNSLLGKLVGR